MTNLLLCQVAGLSLRHRLPAVTLIVLCTLLQACSGCQTFACVNGIFVSFNAAPPMPFTVELLQDGVAVPGGTPVTCNVSSPCTTPILLAGTPTTNVAIRVTTPQGVRVTDYPTVRYRSERPDDGCVTCRYADLVAQVP